MSMLNEDNDDSLSLPSSLPSASQDDDDISLPSVTGDDSQAPQSSEPELPSDVDLTDADSFGSDDLPSESDDIDMDLGLGRAEPGPGREERPRLLQGQERLLLLLALALKKHQGSESPKIAWSCTVCRGSFLLLPAWVLLASFP